MEFKEFILKYPLILVGILFVSIGLIFFLIGRLLVTSTIQEFLNDIALLVLLIIIIFSVIETHSAYRRNDRPHDSFFIPLFFSVFFICLTLILMLFFGILRDVYIKSVEPELNHIVFPLAIFALGISLYYFFIVQFSTDRKLNKISEELKEIKDNSKSDLPKKETVDPTLVLAKKEYLTISDEDKIIFEHLFDRHKNLLSYNDILDTKVAQVIALNGLLLTVFVFNAKNANLWVLYFLGIFTIIISIVTGFLCYRSYDFFIGASVKFFNDYDTFSEGVGLQKLKKQLLLDIKRNQRTHEMKASLFNKMIYIMFIGLFLIVVGYYG